MVLVHPLFLNFTILKMLKTKKHIISNLVQNNFEGTCSPLESLWEPSFWPISASVVAHKNETMKKNNEVYLRIDAILSSVRKFMICTTVDWTLCSIEFLEPTYRTVMHCFNFLTPRKTALTQLQVKWTMILVMSSDRVKNRIH